MPSGKKPVVRRKHKAVRGQQKWKEEKRLLRREAGWAGVGSGAGLSLPAVTPQKKKRVQAEGEKKGKNSKKNKNKKKKARQETMAKQVGKNEMERRLVSGFSFFFGVHPVP